MKPNTDSAGLVCNWLLLGFGNEGVPKYPAKLGPGGVSSTNERD